MNDFYGREAQRFIDGSLVFRTNEDEANEAAVAKILEAHWNCECRPMGKLAAIDWFFVRHERIVGVGELKIHRCAFGEYDSVFLNLRKWHALGLCQHGMNTPAVYVSQWSDKLGFINWVDIDASKHKIGGCKPRGPKSRSDTEPLIVIPTSSINIISNQGYANAP